MRIPTRSSTLFLRLALLVLLISLVASAAPASAAAGGGITIQILVESGRTMMTSPGAGALDACLDPDSPLDGALLRLEDDGLSCLEPTGGSALACARADGICIVDNLPDAVIGPCDAATGERTIELTFGVIRDAGPLELEWPIDEASRCSSASGICGARDDAAVAPLVDAASACADLDGDGLADLFTTGDTLRCSAVAPDGQPLVETARVEVLARCDTELGDVLEAMLGAQTATYLRTIGGVAVALESR